MKQIKLFGVLAIALALGLTACGGAGGKSGSESSKHVHTFDTTKWESDDNAHWHPATCEHTNQKGDRANHDFGEPYDVVPAECEKAGSQKVKCKVCNKEVTQEIKALDHAWVDDEAGAVAPTCTQPGSKNQTCSRCGKKQEGVVVDALGHSWGDWVQVEGKAPTCEKAGEEKRTCSRCNEVETQEVPALGHKFELDGQPTDPEPGKATVRIYSCVNGCGQKSLGFRANEVSADSKSHLNFTEPNDKGEVGASFWGRPIGNAIALDATGTSVHQEDNECVYCSTETGDFFEYVFDLTKEQAEQLSTCRCYCDAMPADHLSGDFWAYNAQRNTDWTPGFYIDGADEHVEMENDQPVMIKDHALPVRAEDGSEAEGVELETEVKKGKRIDDYRYILYVDNKVQSFDKDIKVQVQANTRKEYVMPFTFHLHEGENRISLRMAGGYRSTFYNFTFRPYVEPTPVVADQAEISIKEGETAQITSSMTELAYKSANANIATVSDTGLVTGVAAGKTTITISKEGNYKDLQLPVTINEKDGVLRVEAEDGTSEGDAVTFRTVSSGEHASDTFPEGASLTLKLTATVAGKYNLSMHARGNSSSTPIVLETVMGLKVNGADVAVSGNVLGRTFADYLLGEVNLVVGENTIVITHLTGSMPNIDYLRAVPQA